MSSEVEIEGGVTVRFPYEPYDVQKVYMEKVVQCLRERAFGLLESPTGTGKTLALLCASLAWLQHDRGSQANNRVSDDADIRALLEAGPEADGAPVPGRGWAGGGALSGQGVPPIQQQQLPQQQQAVRCRIVYASRTHSQLAQVIQEFRRCPYSDLPAVILASREQLCINEQLATVPDKNQMCRAKLKTRSCEYYNNIEKSLGNFSEAGECGGDVDSLRKSGLRKRMCPYYISRDLASNADIVFMPYNYLVDPRIRKSLAVNLEECVVIVDEAHNVLKIFEESASLSFSGKDVAVALADLDYLLKVLEDQSLANNIESLPSVDLSEVYALKDCVAKFESSLSEFDKTLKVSAADPEDLPGDKILDILERSEIGFSNAGLISTAISGVLDTLSVISIAAGSTVTKGKGLAKVLELLELLFFANSRDKVRAYYRFHAERKSSREGRAGMPSVASSDTEYNLWCFHPGFSLSSLVACKIRTLILTSGTLKPLESFGRELDAGFPVTLQNNHVIDAKRQICYQVLTHGPDNGPEFVATFASRNDRRYLSSLGTALVQIAKQVPDGLLVFFPSYPWMDACVNHWQAYDGLWNQLNSVKECFVEPKDRNLLTKVVSEFRAKVRAAGAKEGACLMAVCRGKVSEGIDFADRDARAVVVTGIPFPSIKDPKVLLKKKFLDANNKPGEGKGLSGTDWYSMEAFRALNQAIGRVIRHKDDFGAVILLDKRFSLPGNAARLPAWLLTAAVENNFRKGMATLAKFFHMNRNTFVAAKSRSIGASSAVKVSKLDKDRHQHLPVVQADDNPQKKRKIVLKPRTTGQAGQAGESGATSGSMQPPSKSGNIQEFVVQLKSKLDRATLKSMICHVRTYKENNDIGPLLEQLRSLLTKKAITTEDLTKFRPFIRFQDEELFSKTFGTLPH